MQLCMLSRDCLVWKSLITRNIPQHIKSSWYPHSIWLNGPLSEILELHKILCHFALSSQWLPSYLRLDCRLNTLYGCKFTVQNLWSRPQNLFHDLTPISLHSSYVTCQVARQTPALKQHLHRLVDFKSRSCFQKAELLRSHTNVDWHAKMIQRMQNTLSIYILIACSIRTHGAFDLIS